MKLRFVWTSSKIKVANRAETQTERCLAWVAARLRCWRCYKPFLSTQCSGPVEAVVCATPAIIPALSSSEWRDHVDIKPDKSGQDTLGQ